MNENKCPYCRGVKRIRDDLVHYTRRSILEIKHGNQLWSKFILPNNEYEVMAYIRFCPMCGRNLMEEKIMSSFYITCVDGTPILNIVETNAGSFELWWKDSYQCNLGTFKTYEAAVDAIYKHYGRGRVIKC